MVHAVDIPVSVIALDLGCEACGEVARLDVAKADALADPQAALTGWFAGHTLPVILGWDAVIGDRVQHWTRISS